MTTTLIAAMGMKDERCSTVVDGAINRDVLDAFVDQVLLPELRKGDAVILDNLFSHKSEHARKTIESQGAGLTSPHAARRSTVQATAAVARPPLLGHHCKTLQSALDQVIASGYQVLPSLRLHAKTRLKPL